MFCMFYHNFEKMLETFKNTYHSGCCVKSGLEKDNNGSVKTD